MGWSLEALGNSALVTIYPFFIRYVVISDGARAEQRQQSIDPQASCNCDLAITFAAKLLCWMCQAGQHTACHSDTARR